MLKIITLIAFCALSFAADVAETKPTELAPAATKELKSLAASLADNQRVKDTADLKVITSSKKALKKVVDALLASKDLDGANLVNSEIKKLDDQIAKLTGMGDVDAKVLLAGKWTVDCEITHWHGTILVNVDNTANCSNGVNGTWKIINGNFFIQWNGMKDSITMKIDETLKDGVMNGTDHNANAVVLKQIKSK